MKSERLQTKISKYFTVFIICIIMLLSTVIGLYSSHKLETETGENLTNVAGQISVQLDQFMWNHYHQLNLLEEANNVVPVGDYEVSSALINKLHDSFPSFSWVGITDADGIVRASSDDILLGADISERPVFIEGAKGEFIGDVHDAKLLSELLPNPSGEPLRFVDISLALYDEKGAFVGVLAAHLNWDWAQQRIAMTTQSLGDSQQIEVLVLSNGYDVLLGPKPYIGTSVASIFEKSEASEHRGWEVVTWPDKQKYLTGVATSAGYDDYDGLGWSVVVRQPVKTAYKDIVELLAMVVASGCVLLLFSILFGTFFSKKLTEPLNQLSEVAILLKSGKHAVMPDYKGIYELENLEAALSNLFSDLTLSDAALSQMKTIAATDPLTGLQNRRAFENEIRQRCGELEKGVFSIAIIYLDLDGFKGVNDRFGHDIGDKLLAGIAQRLTAAVGSGTLLSRIGGDEFLLAMTLPSDEARSVVGRETKALIEEINRPFQFESCEIRVGGSIGVSIYPEDSEELLTIIKYADTALYHSKSHGRNQVTIYSKSIE